MNFNYERKRNKDKFSIRHERKVRKHQKVALLIQKRIDRKAQKA